MERMISTQPLRLPRSKRRDEWRGLTSMRAGDIRPIAFFPLLREDSLRGRFMAQVRMEEALHTIVNPIRVTMTAYLVAKIALERFDGSMETLNRSYAGEKMPGGAVAAPPWHVADPIVRDSVTPDKGHVLFDSLGVHYKAGMDINSDLLESYWTVINWRRAAVSKALTKIPVTTNAFAPAFWNSWKFDMIKPSFDAAMMEAAVPIDIQGQAQAVVNPITLPGATPGVATGVDLQLMSDTKASSEAQGFKNPLLYVQDADNTVAGLGIEVPSGGAFISLAAIQQAKKAQAFAKMRERYSGVPDEYLVNLLMEGIRVPPEDFREPILIGRSSTVIGQVERYATDGASLDQSVTNGMAMLSMTLNTPAVNPGGMVVVMMEIVPEQLWERVDDAALRMDENGTAEWLPNAKNDYLDPQKVEVVKNGYADSFHAAPDDVFGYAPLNFEWQRSFARVGGRYKRDSADAWREDRARIWAVEKDDPTLSADFYVCPQPFPHDVFADKDSDPFEVITVGNCTISGLTVFGSGFEEDYDHYEKIMADVDQTRLTGDAVAGTATVSTPSTQPAPVASDEGEESNA